MVGYFVNGLFAELRLECVRYWRERRRLFVIARSTADPASANCYVRLLGVLPLYILVAVAIRD